MITLRPITMEQADILDGFSYGTMSHQDRVEMIMESNRKLHCGKYFEFLVVYLYNEVIGLMSLYAHSAHIISCGPEIKPDFQHKGYAFEAEKRALIYAKNQGYHMAIGDVDETNLPSQKLHEKLGFELERTYVNKKGKTMRLYLKAL